MVDISNNWLDNPSLFFTQVIDKNAEECWALTHHILCETWKKKCFRNLVDAETTLLSGHVFRCLKAFKDRRKAIKNEQHSGDL